MKVVAVGSMREPDDGEGKWATTKLWTTTCWYRVMLPPSNVAIGTFSVASWISNDKTFETVGVGTATK